MILAAVSGGLDSVALLWRLLTDGEPVHVHHVSLRSSSGRWKAEDAAMRLIVPWMRGNVGEFGYTESVARPNGCDIAVVSREAGRMCRATGLRPIALARGSAAHDATAPGIRTRQAAALREWQKCWPSGKAPPIVFPISTVTRAEMWGWLPDELRGITASCRKPMVASKIYVACGDCRPCRQFVSDGLPLERRVPA